MVEKIYNKKNLYALIVRRNYKKKKGVNFFTDKNATQQFGYMNHGKNHFIKPHTHRNFIRKINKTAEVLFVKNGILRIDFYASKTKYLLRSNISFVSSETLSVNGSDTLNSTFAKANFSLIESKSNKVISSGTIKTFPALSSSSSSIYSNDMSVQHIKERLIFSAAKGIYMRLNLILQKLN